MKADFYFLLIAVMLTTAASTSAQSASAAEIVSPHSIVHERILVLLKKDVAKISLNPKEAPAPFLNPDVVPNDQPVAEGVLELEPLQVTKKRPIELPRRINPVTLDKFFYDDGAIFKNTADTFMISVSPEGSKGLAAIKFTLKF